MCGVARNVARVNPMENISRNYTAKPESPYLRLRPQRGPCQPHEKHCAQRSLEPGSLYLRLRP